MASTSFISQPQKVNSELAESGESSSSSAEIVPQWPALNASNNHNQTKDSEWELVPPSSDAEASVGTFDNQALSERNPSKQSNSKTLKHSQSSPDFRSSWRNMEGVVSDEEEEYYKEDEEESSSAVLVEDETSMASSGADLVSEQPSVWSVGSNKWSFKDAILQKPAAPSTSTNTTTNTKNNNNKSPKKATFKTTFVVVEPPPLKATHARRNSRSMGNLRALDHIQESPQVVVDEENILGETDAGEFYSRKAKGAQGRKNGQKIRPDEAKRLQITMSKKTMQKQSQMKRG